MKCKKLWKRERECMDTKLQKNRLGFYEIIDKPTVEELQAYYAKKYFQDAKGSYELKYTKDELKYFQIKLEQRYAALQDIQSKLDIFNPGSFLDVGCGEGYAMAYFKEQGYTIKGLDFSAAGVASKNPKCLDALITGDLFQLLQSEVESGRRYDIVWLQNVLEHVLDPIDLMKTLHNLVSTTGIAVVTVPNDCSSVQQDALDRGHIDQSFWVAIPDHISYFDKDSLNNIARETNWEMVDLLGDFPIDWYLYHPGSNYVMNPKVGKHAHYARVQLEILLAENHIQDTLELWRAIGKMGLGRDLTAFIAPIKE